MIIVVPKVHLDGNGGYQTLTPEQLKKECLRVVSFIHDPQNGFVALCERLFEKTYYAKKTNEFGDTIGDTIRVNEKVGDIIPLRVQGLRIIKNTGLDDELDDERKHYLKELNLFLKGEELS